MSAQRSVVFESCPVGQHNSLIPVTRGSWGSQSYPPGLGNITCNHQKRSSWVDFFFPAGFKESPKHMLPPMNMKRRPCHSQILTSMCKFRSSQSLIPSARLAALPALLWLPARAPSRNQPMPAYPSVCCPRSLLNKQIRQTRTSFNRDVQQ